MTTLDEHLSIRRQMFYPKADLGVSDAFLRSLSQVSSRFSDAQLLAALCSAGFCNYTCVPMAAQGTFHTLYRCSDPSGSQVVLRLSRLSECSVDWQLEVEQSVSKLLEANCLEHPKVYLADCSRNRVPFDFQILECVNGQRLKDLDDDDELFAARLPDVALYLSSLHNVVGDGYGLVARNERSCSGISGLSKTWVQYLSKRFEEHLAILRHSAIISAEEENKSLLFFKAAEAQLSLVPSRLLHGDCGSHNIIIPHPGSVSLLDWEDALFGDPIFEIASWATFNPPRRWDAFFKSYFHQDWRPNFLFWFYFLRIAICRTVVRLRFGYQDKPGRPKASLRIQQALKGLAESM